jgi:hypothetical protein
MLVSRLRQNLILVWSFWLNSKQQGEVVEVSVG